MAELTETIDVAADLLREVTHDPESAAAEAAAGKIADDIARFLRSDDARAFLWMVATHRARPTVTLAPKVARLYEGFHVAMSIGLQLYEMGRPVTWVPDLLQAMAWLSGWLSAIGVPTPALTAQALPVPPMVVLSEGEHDDAPPRVEVIMSRIRAPRLAPYVALAMQRARAERNPEDGRWFSELDDAFRGVWAEGATREEALAQLSNVLHEWLIVKAQHGDADLPVLNGLDPRALILAA